MNRKNRIFTGISLIIIIFLFSCSKQHTADFFISPDGNDTNAGTESQPFQSLEKAKEAVQLKLKENPNDTVTVCIKGGNYYLGNPVAFTTEDSGTESAPVVYRAAKDEEPVFYGGKKLQKFEKISEDLWRVKIPGVIQYNWHFEQLIVNGQLATRAKSPNSGFFYLSKVVETIIKRGTGRIPELSVKEIKLFEDGAEQLSELSKKELNDAIITFYFKWNTSREHVFNFDKDSSAIYTVGDGMAPWNKLDGKTRYKLENYKAALDTCGEWYLENSGYLYYIPRPGETPENTTAIAPFLKQLIVFTGNKETGEKVKNIRFEGLSFQATSYTMPVTGDDRAQAASPVDALIMADYAENIHFSNCEISNTANNAVWMRNACKNCSIEHCYFHDLGAGGIKLGTPAYPKEPEDLTQNIIVDNNIIRSGGYVFPTAVGLTIFKASDNQITHNEIADFRYSGVSVGWVWGYADSPSKRNTIDFNHIHHIGWGELCDMGGVYCLGKSEGTTVSNNVIHDIYSFEYGGWGLYTDEGSTGITMENNLVYRCKDSGFHQHYGENNIIRNNIFVNNILGQLQATKIEDHLSFTFTNNIIYFNSGELTRSNWTKINLKTDYNCYWDTRTKDIRFGDLSFDKWKESGNDEHSIIADPQFADPAKFDFTIKNDSVIKAIDFNVFDYSQAGVYGSDEWKKRAEFNSDLARLFDKMVAANRNNKEE